MNTEYSETVSFPIREELARGMRRGVWFLFLVLILFGLLVIFAYDFDAEANSPLIIRTIFYGATAGTFAILMALVWTQWRKAPKDAKATGLEITDRKASVDFGRGKVTIDLGSVSGLVPLARVRAKKPQVIVFLQETGKELSSRDGNRVMHKVGDRWGRVTTFKKNTVLPIFLFGEDQADLILSTLQDRLDRVSQNG